MYQALYRKYRPLCFADVVGQQAVTQTLMRQIETGRIAHAYLFTGTRGTGKTTCAKIFARAVNCAAVQAGDPCNTCDSCKGILNGSIMDIYEIDAASNNSVGDVRELREDVIYTPASAKYKVYIIDEVHRMSGAAFDALLKTIEEPPAHVIFILATTELHKVPATILSRCQRFDFRRIDTADIAARLQWVADQEQLQLTEDAARMLARMAQGSMRDALSLLERTVALGGDIDVAAVGQLLGLCDPAQMMVALQQMAQGNTAHVLQFLDDMWHSSKDIRRLLDELAALLRDVMLAKISPQMLAGGRSDEQAAQLAALGEQFTLPRILYMIETLQKGMRDVAAAEDIRVVTELIMIRLCDPSLEDSLSALLPRIEALEEGRQQGGGPQPKKVQATPPPVVSSAPAAPKQPTQKTEKAAVEPQKQAIEPTVQSAESVDWKRVLQLLKEDGQNALPAVLQNLQPVFQNEALYVKADDFTKMLLSKTENTEALQRALFKASGKNYAIRFAQPTPKKENDAFLELADEIDEMNNRQ